MDYKIASQKCSNCDANPDIIFPADILYNSYFYPCNEKVVLLHLPAASSSTSPSVISLLKNISKLASPSVLHEHITSSVLALYF